MMCLLHRFHTRPTPGQSGASERGLSRPLPAAPPRIWGRPVLAERDRVGRSGAAPGRGCSIERPLPRSAPAWGGVRFTSGSGGSNAICVPRRLAIVTVSALTLWIVTGCSQGSSAVAPGEGENAQASAADSGKSGAELWAENCNRCHNVRPPPSFSDTQWSAIVHHMRQRANLTGEEARQITVFLQSANQ
jgi:hypothetical protein